MPPSTTTAPTMTRTEQVKRIVEQNGPHTDPAVLWEKVQAAGIDIDRSVVYRTARRLKAITPAPAAKPFQAPRPVAATPAPGRRLTRLPNQPANTERATDEQVLAVFRTAQNADLTYGQCNDLLAKSRLWVEKNQFGSVKKKYQIEKQSSGRVAAKVTAPTTPNKETEKMATGTAAPKATTATPPTVQATPVAAPPAANGTADANTLPLHMKLREAKRVAQELATLAGGKEEAKALIDEIM